MKYFQLWKYHAIVTDLKQTKDIIRKMTSLLGKKYSAYVAKNIGLL